MSAQVSRSNLRRVLWAALIAVVATLGAGSAFAQTITGSVRGYVRDQAGAPLADALVSARNVDLGIIRTVMTNAAGFYNVPGLRPGTYEINARHLGHSPRVQTVQVPIAQTVTADIVLASGAVQLQAVTTVADVVALKTSEIGMNVSAEQIRDLPIFDRNFLDFAKLVPGITPKNVNDDTKFITAGGQPAEAINIFVDGASYKNDVLKGGVLAQDASKGNPFPQGAVQEFRVITQNYKAEYQKASSAIITATTKTGTNQWEADAFAFSVAKNYVAKDAFGAREARARSNYTRLQAGGSVGGPIKQNKLFFFGTYEFNSRDEPRDVVLGGECGARARWAEPAAVCGALHERVSRAPRLREAHVDQVGQEHDRRQCHVSSRRRLSRLRRRPQLRSRREHESRCVDRRRELASRRRHVAERSPGQYPARRVGPGAEESRISSARTTSASSASAVATPVRRSRRTASRCATT